MVVETTHLRADAQRNLERILEAARAVFAEEGLEASVADVAHRAGVGTATIFRRFPTKDDLVAAMLERELETVVARAQAAAETKDPAAALAEFFSAAVETFVEDRCFCEASGGDLFERPRMQELLGELIAALDQLLGRARAAGAIRRDVVAEDIGFLINAIGLGGVRLEHTAPGAWRRYVEIVLAGLAPHGGRKLAHKPPTQQQLHDSKRSAKDRPGHAR
ncbi:MAG TPA: helix-turn-helix domain-containing protein [Gaiellaceae bacterium]|jgi:AcrR family transcriptional regulator